MDLCADDEFLPVAGRQLHVLPQHAVVHGLGPKLTAARDGVVAKLVEKQQPTADEIAKNLDQTRDTLVNQRRDQMFEVFVTTLVDKYQKEGRIHMNKNTQSALAPGAAS